MFDFVWDVKIGYVLCGIIWLMMCGFAVGNYACSLIHRLPRGRLVLDKPPYCGTCGTLLATRDLFPVFSALMLRHKCRYCGTKFPVSHTWTELLVAFLFVLAFFKYGFGDIFVLASILGVFLIVLAAIEANERMIMGKIIVCIAITGMVYRTLVDASIFNFLESALLGLFLGALLWRKGIRKVGHIYVIPRQVQMLAAGGLVMGSKLLVPFLGLFAGLSALFYLLALVRRKPFAITIPFGITLMLLVLYPQLIPPLHF